MTPLEYKARYMNLMVPVPSGRSQVRVNQYLLVSGGYPNTEAYKKFEGRVYDLKKKNESIDVDPGTGSESIDGALLWNLHRLPFTGKGAPEHCQIVLQLAYQWGLTTNLQQYADSNLGLDCNGFVGNYLWHGKDGKHWKDLGLKKGELGPSVTIDGYFPNNPNDSRYVKDWNAIGSSKLYVMGRVDANGNIIPQVSGGVIGHIVITQPDPTRNSGHDHDVLAVESTGSRDPKGLSENWYSLIEAKNGVFEIDRGQDFPTNRRIKFRIAEVGSAK
jgi:hypothetical protein